MESDESVANQERWFAHAPDRHMHTAKPSGRQTERNWTGRKIGKRRCVPCAEFVLRVVVPSKRSCQLSHPPLVGLQVLGVFRVDGLELALSCPLGEQRRKEELRKSVQSPSELARHHIKVEIRVFEGGVSIRSATVHGEKALVLGLVRVLGGAQKEHVLEKMCQTRKFGRVRGVWVRHEHHLQLVPEPDVPVPPVIAFRFTDVVATVDHLHRNIRWAQRWVRRVIGRVGVRLRPGHDVGDTLSAHIKVAYTT
eukprot:scaffold47312_cov30-Tisochrysis_lutea.AAC.4